MSDQRKRNIRTAVLLAAVAAAFMFSVIAKRMWFS